MKRAEAYSSMHQLIDGKYRPAPGNWIKYEDHLAVVADCEQLLEAAQKVGAIALGGAGAHAERVVKLQSALKNIQKIGETHPDPYVAGETFATLARIALRDSQSDAGAAK